MTHPVTQSVRLTAFVIARRSAPLGAVLLALLARASPALGTEAAQESAPASTKAEVAGSGPVGEEIVIQGQRASGYAARDASTGH